jgi:hypothetical protein
MNQLSTAAHGALEISRHAEVNDRFLNQTGNFTTATISNHTLRRRHFRVIAELVTTSAKIVLILKQYGWDVFERGTRIAAQKTETDQSQWHLVIKLDEKMRDLVDVRLEAVYTGSGNLYSAVAIGSFKKFEKQLLQSMEQYQPSRLVN